MMRPEPSFTIGIEEEYLLVDKQTRELVIDAPGDLLPKCQAALGSQVSAEFMRSQIEIGTKVCASPAEAKAELRRLRRTIADIAGEFGLAPIAASTHPSARWSAQRHSDKDRYHALARDLQVVARRMIICGMHVHVGIEDSELRIDLMNQLSYFLPHLLALSTSSPFWQGELTGLKSYRLSVFDELPRTGLPEHFSGHDEYQRSIEVLVKAGLIEDATKIWWDLRPSARFPTLEMRITDVCPLLDDTVAIAALYICICRMLYRLRRVNQRWRHYSHFLINENRWRAKRYGMASGLVDFGKGEVIPFAELLEELLELVAEDVDHFGCRKEVEHARAIVRDGTSADRQAQRHAAFLENGSSTEKALQAVVDGLIEETVRGV